MCSTVVKRRAIFNQLFSTFLLYICNIPLTSDNTFIMMLLSFMFKGNDRVSPQI